MNDRPPSLSPWPVTWWIWTLGQAAVLAMYAGGVGPSAGYPPPVEGTADLGVACVQVILGSLLGPDLLGTPTRFLRAIAAALPMTALAALLAGRGLSDVLRTNAVVLVWTAAFAITRRPALRDAVILLTLGGPFLWYLSLEYGRHPMPLGSWPTLLSPPLGICSTALHNGLLRPCIVAGLVLAATTAEAWLRDERPTSHL